MTQRQFTAMLSSAAIPHSREELLRIIASAESAEQEIRAIEDRSTTYWLLEYLARYKKDEAMPAIALDAKGNVELADYFLRAKLTGVRMNPGETIQVRIEAIDPAKGEIRLIR